jgi:peptidoglycan hydrolase CwlO-like protein
METIVTDIWQSLLGAFITAIGLYAGYIRKLIVDVAVLHKTVENQQKIIDNMTKRLDAHSKKQDEIFDTLNDMKVELVKQMGQMGASIGSLASDVKNLNNLLAITDSVNRSK